MRLSASFRLISLVIVALITSASPSLAQKTSKKGTRSATPIHKESDQFDPVLQARYERYLADGTLQHDPQKLAMSQDMLQRGIIHAVPAGKSDIYSGLDLAIVEQPTFVFTEPNTASSHIANATAKEKLILVSRFVTDGWVSVIDYSTGRQGWILSQRVRFQYAAHKDAPVNLPGEAGNTSESGAVVDITNDMDIPLFLHVEGLPEVKIDSGTKKSVQVPSGVRLFNASGPLMRPKFGSKAFENGERYFWKWWTGKGSDTSRTASKEEAKEFKDKQSKVDTDIKDLKERRETLDTLEKNIESEKTNIATERNEINTKRPALEAASQDEVDAFNRLVTKANADLDTYHEHLVPYKKIRDEYNQMVDQYQEDRKSLDATEHRINGIHAK